MSENPDSILRSPAGVLLINLGLSILALIALIGAIALAIDFLGDPEDSLPEIAVALFAEEHNGSKPLLKRRLAGANGNEHQPHAHSDHHDSDADDADETMVTITHNSDDGRHHVVALPPAPIGAVHKSGKFGALPGIAEDGLSPARAYARPYTSSTNARIGIVFGGLGQNRELTERAIRELPPEITLSFVPYAKGLQSWIDKARASGHEVLLEIPMEPYDYPNNDPGPHTLLIGNNANENKRRLSYLLSRAAGYFGLINYQGAKFFTSAQALAPVVREVSQHGLAFINDGSAPRSRFMDTATGLDFAIADSIIDTIPDKKLIAERFVQLESMALSNDQAFATGFAYPVTLDLLLEWTPTLKERGFDLAPVSFFAGIKAAGDPS